MFYQLFLNSIRFYSNIDKNFLHLLIPHKFSPKSFNLSFQPYGAVIRIAIFFINFEKPHFGPILAAFGLKISRKDFYQNNDLYFKTLSCCKFMQKNQKNYKCQFSIKFEKHFGLNWALLAKKTQN